MKHTNPGRLTLWIFSVTIIYHLLIVNTDNPRSFLGGLMIIPLVVLMLQKVITRERINQQAFSLRKTSKSILAISALLPIALGILIHYYFQISNQGVFLFQEMHEIGVMVLIGLTIATISALIEEVVWRGYYHTYLRKTFSFNQTALIVACTWTIWHLPIAILYKEYTNLVIGIAGYLGILFVTSYLLTLFREVSGSVWPSAFFHGMMNVFYFGDGIEMHISLHHLELIKLIILLLSAVLVFYLMRFRIKST